MNQTLKDKIEAAQLRKDKVDFAVGDSVRVHTQKLLKAINNEPNI
jgi:hypothetical protein